MRRAAPLAGALLGAQSEAGGEARDYLLLAAMAGYIASGEPAAALAQWRSHAAQLRKRDSAAFSPPSLPRRARRLRGRIRRALARLLRVGIAAGAELDAQRRADQLEVVAEVPSR